MEVAVEFQDIKYIKEHMTDTVENWTLLFIDKFIFKVPEFISFISSYPLQWITENLCSIYGFDNDNIYRMLRLFPKLLKAFIPIFTNATYRYRVLPIKCILEYDGPLFLHLPDLINAIRFKENDRDDIDKFFLKMYQTVPHEFNNIINLKITSKSYYYASLCWKKYTNRTNEELINQGSQHKNIIWRLILGYPIMDTIQLIIENGFEHNAYIIHCINIIIKDLDQLELIIDLIGPLNSIETANHYIDCPERLIVLQKKYPNELLIPKEILKNGKDSDIIYWTSITKLIHHRHFKYLRPSILPYITIRKGELLQAIKNKLNWSVITDIIHHYYNYNIDLVTGLMLLKMYLDKSTIIIEDFDINPNAYIFEDAGYLMGALDSTSFIIKTAIENGARPYATDDRFESLIKESIKKKQEIEAIITRLYIISHSITQEITEIRKYEIVKCSTLY
jgi:hypothetical protein